MKRDRKCSVPGCASRHSARGFCGTHYTRWKVYGDPLAVVRKRAPHLSGPAELERILSLPPTTDCICWPYSRNSTGYGRVWLNGALFQTHRIVCERVHGPAPEGRTDAAHSCNNRACCNPAHLRWATPKENQADRIEHDTHLRGLRHPGAKLSDEQARYIIANPERLSQNALARQFGCSQSLIGLIKRGVVRKWLHKEPADA